MVLAPLNLCAETLDGVRNHSWSRPAPATPEGAVVSWADRCAYSAHDFEDAVRAGIVIPAMLPGVVAERAAAPAPGNCRPSSTPWWTGSAPPDAWAWRPAAEALAALRAFNYESIYLRPASHGAGAKR